MSDLNFQKHVAYELKDIKDKLSEVLKYLDKLEERMIRIEDCLKNEGFTPG